MLEPTELRLYKSESDVERFAQGEGYLQVGPRGRARARRGGHRAPTSSTAPTSRSACASAEEAAEQAEDGSEEQRRAARDKKRWEAFLDIAGGS